MIQPPPTAGPVTLVARLAGPVQSWGEHGPFTYRGTLPYPTYSGLLGLLRAALGIGRHTPAHEWKWLRELAFTIRVDRPGQLLSDYHTINPPPGGSWGGPWGNPVPFTIPMGGLSARGTARPWLVGGRPSTAVTHRAYLTDAAFTWLISGEPEPVHRIQKALRRPQWQLSAGRKACLPDWPMALGGSLVPSRELVEQVPATTGGPSGATATVAVHVVHGAITLNGSPVTVTHVDDPIGSHPHHGHLPHTRHIHEAEVTVGTRAELLTWAGHNLEA